MTSAERRSLKGYGQALKRIGKGTGKMAEHHRQTARQQMLEAQDAVPVWIMPLGTAIDSFRPSQQPFDVVIVDEASQASLFGLAVVALGRRCVIVGDDQQISPTSFVNQTQANELIDTHLDSGSPDERVPSARAFNVTTSLYDTADTLLPRCHHAPRALPLRPRNNRVLERPRLRR